MLGEPATICDMAFRRKPAEAKAAEPKAPRKRRAKPEPPAPPTFDAPPTLTSDERYAEAAEAAPVRRITDHDEEW
jgi:hypothetical protein